MTCYYLTQYGWSVCRAESPTVFKILAHLTCNYLMTLMTWTLILAGAGFTLIRWRTSVDWKSWFWFILEGREHFFMFLIIVPTQMAFRAQSGHVVIQMCGVFQDQPSAVTAVRTTQPAAPKSESVAMTTPASRSGREVQSHLLLPVHL